MSFQGAFFSFFIIGALCLCASASAYRYLLIIPTVAPSHYSIGTSLAKGLAGAGHQVTIISPLTLKEPRENIEEIQVKGLIKAMEDDVAQLLESLEKPLVERFTQLYKMSLKTTKALLDEPEVQVLLKSNRTFDAVICEVFVNEAHFGFAEHFRAPLIGYGTFGATYFNTDLVGTPSPPSYVPHFVLKFTDRMILWQRIINLAFLTTEFFVMNFFHWPNQAKISKQYFPNNKQTLGEIRRNTSLVLLNTHVSLAFPRPYSPNMIEVGGIHIDHKIKPLPADIERFINEAEHGVIYFSMGSNIKSKNLPLEKRNTFLNVFRKLKQRVLWKFEDSNLPNMPENVLISDWFPQSDILAHKNIILFITHGGLLSIIETVYHGKPIIGIPIFADQFLNMAQAEQHGYGITVSYNELTEDKLANAVTKIITEPSYTTNVRQRSAHFRDQKETPLERAIYWVEHVTRHKGARYLRSASQDLNFIQYHNLDAMLILYGGILIMIAIVILLLITGTRIVIKFLYANKKKSIKRKVKHN